MTDKTKFGDAIKEIEMQEAGRKMVLPLPVVARLDGRAFHTYTSGLARPYDLGFSRIMQETTKALVKEFHADVGYTQSDEITLVWRKPVLFDGRYQKLTSVLASYAAAYFNSHKQAYMIDPQFYWRQHMSLAIFDCRVFQVNNLARAIDVLSWREYDATKNSVAMAAQSYFSHKALQNKHRGDMMDMLHSVGVNWNDYPAFFKRGTYFKRVSKMVVLGEDELARIPEEHRPTGPVMRTRVEDLELSPIREYPETEIVSILFPTPEEK